MKKTSRQPNEIEGGILRPSASISDDYAKQILAEVRRLAEEIRSEVNTLFIDRAFDAAMDDNAAIAARVAFNNLLSKWEPRFNRLAKKATKRMISRTLKNSEVTLGSSLKQISEGLKLDTSVLTDRLNEVVTAATTEATSLIKLIPSQYLAQVQNQVMRSITTGQGLKELVPFLNEKYGQNVRHARNVAMDQTRKTYSSINAERMKAVGVKKFKWLHVGGSRHPRKDHIELNGQVFSYDDPPVIGVMYGQDVRGLPGTLPNCRCVCRPLLDFASM